MNCVSCCSMLAGMPQTSNTDNPTTHHIAPFHDRQPPMLPPPRLIPSYSFSVCRSKQPATYTDSSWGCFASKRCEFVSLMLHYHIERVIGDGSFGSVVAARHTSTNNLVAIKHLKRTFNTFDDAMREREVQSLLLLPPHPHVVQLREVIYERQQLSLVFEHVQGNLLQWLRALSRPLPQHSIKHIVSRHCTQLTQSTPVWRR